MLGILPDKQLPSENTSNIPHHPPSQHLAPFCGRPVPNAVSKHLPLLFFDFTLKCHPGESVQAITTPADTPQKYQLLGNLYIFPHPVMFRRGTVTVSKASFGAVSKRVHRSLLAGSHHCHGFPATFSLSYSFFLPSFFSSVKWE